MNILITSGSTTEYIDDVNFIGSIGDGSLGSVIGEEFSKQGYVNKVFYLYGRDARYPWQYSSNNDQKFFLDDWVDKIALFPVDSPMSLESAIRELLLSNEVDAIVHLMTISNYGKSQIHLLNNQVEAKFLVEKIASDFGLEVEVKHPTESSVNCTSNKILSGYSKLFIEQLPNKKILSFFKELSPKSLIVTSKLSSFDSEDELQKTSLLSLEKNHSDFVIGVDVNHIKKSMKETAYLIKPNGELTCYSSNESIANALVDLFRSSKK